MILSLFNSCLLISHKTVDFHKEESCASGLPEEPDSGIFQSPTVLPAAGTQNSSLTGTEAAQLSAATSLCVCVCVFPSTSREFRTTDNTGDSPREPSGHGESPGVTVSSKIWSESWMRGRRGRERERDGEKPAWPVGNFNKRQSDFSEAIIIKILPPRLFV